MFLLCVFSFRSAYGDFTAGRLFVLMGHDCVHNFFRRFFVKFLVWVAELLIRVNHIVYNVLGGWLMETDSVDRINQGSK